MAADPTQRLLLEENFSFFFPVCDECGPERSDVFQDDKEGRYVCRSCGTIVKDTLISEYTEWRNFGESKDDPSRVGDASASHEGEIESTTFGTTATDADGGYVKVGRMGRNGKDKHQLQAHSYAASLREKLHATTLIMDDCLELYRKVDEAGDLKARPLEAVVAACMLAALKRHGVARTIKEIGEFVTVNVRDIKKVWVRVVEHAKKLFRKDREFDMRSNSDGSQFLPRFCDNLRLPPAVQNAAVAIAKGATEFVEGKLPMTIAAASLYFACQLHPTEKRPIEDIAANAGISADTVRRCFRELYPYRLKLVPKDYVSSQTLEKMTVS